MPESSDELTGTDSRTRKAARVRLRGQRVIQVTCELMKSLSIHSPQCIKLRKSDNALQRHLITYHLEIQPTHHSTSQSPSQSHPRCSEELLPPRPRRPAAPSLRRLALPLPPSPAPPLLQSSRPSAREDTTRRSLTTTTTRAMSEAWERATVMSAPASSAPRLAAM